MQNQSPEPGALVAKNSLVDLGVATGPKFTISLPGEAPGCANNLYVFGASFVFSPTSAHAPLIRITRGLATIWAASNPAKSRRPRLGYTIRLEGESPPSSVLHSPSAAPTVWAG